MTWDKPFNKEGYPQASIIRYQFPARGDLPPVKMTWYDGGLTPERPEELEEGLRMGNNMGGVVFKGDKGKLICRRHGGRARLIPQSFMRAYNRPAQTLPRVDQPPPGMDPCLQTGNTHRLEFRVCRPAHSGGLFGNVALLSPGRKLLWDPGERKNHQCSRGQYFLHYEYRKGWSFRKRLLWCGGRGKAR